MKSLAANLTPVFQIGKSGLTPEIVTAVEECFNTHELIKGSVLKNCLEDPRAMSDIVAGRVHAEVVQVIGRKMILYRPDPDHPKIVLPK